MNADRISSCVPAHELQLANSIGRVKRYIYQGANAPRISKIMRNKRVNGSGMCASGSSVRSNTLNPWTVPNRLHPRRPAGDNPLAPSAEEG